MAGTTSNTDTDIILDVEVRYEKAIKGIAEYQKHVDDAKRANAGFRKENTELHKQLKNNEISQEKYNKKIEENNRAIAANNEITEQYNAKIRALRKEVQNNIKEETNRTGSIKKLEAEIAKLVRQYEVLGDTEAELAQKKEFSDKISSLQKQLNDENAAIGRFYGQVGNYENAIKSALGLNNSFANSFLDLAKSSSTGENSVKSFFANASTSVKAFGSALTGLLANPVFLAIAGIVGVGVAFKFWYDYNKGLEEATRLTKQFTGLAGKELKAYRNEVQGVADTFGKDFKGVLEASNSVAKQFGITQQEALKYIKDGFVAGADANGKYLDTLNKYPSHFREAGISASEFIAITTEATNQGIFSDKGIDAIKEANSRIREMSTSTAAALDGIGISSKQVQKDLQDGTTTTFEVMQKVSAKLNEYPEQSKQVGAAIANIFGSAGKDAGLQYLKTLKDIDANLDNVKKKTGELGEIQERQMNANIELQNAVAALFDHTGGTFETMIGNAKIFATEHLTSIIKGLIGVVNWVIELYNNFIMLRVSVQSVLFVFGSLWEGVKLIFNNIVNGIKLIGSGLLALVKGDFASIPGIYKEYGDKIIEDTRDTWDKIKKNFNEGLEEIKNGKIDPIEIPVNIASATEVVEDTGGKGKGLSEDMKKAMEAEKKAAIELARFKLEVEIKSQKDIADNQDKAYNDRLTALNNYYNLQKAYIEKDKEFQLNQKGLTESQIALIKEKSAQKQLELDKELADKSVQIIKEGEAKQLDVLNTDIQNRLAVIKKGSDEELALHLQQLDIQRQAEIDAAEKTGADKAAINAKYLELERQERQKQTDYINQQSQVEYQNKIMQAELNNNDELARNIAVTQAKITAKQAEIAALTQLENESDADYLNRKLSLQAEEKGLQEELFQYQIDSQIRYMQAASTIAGGFTELFESLAEDNEAFAAFAKAMALYQIGLDTATALSAGIAQAQSVPFPANLAAIATTIATILSNIAKAKKYLSSEKQPKAPSFATGGLVSGLGSGTSDSISARLSNGESVLTARATSMFSPVLSAFNQIGGGVPFSTQDSAGQIMGEDMLSRAFARAVQSLPNPVVSVQEINNVGDRVSILESSSLL